ncbi:hypothetical protein I2I05_08550 [Hymenobacter sp. BT683]|uniref:Phage tail protein n=1 Tax=Hymenobacter jeongseonensis TaxID=2791027 RepID=A0ABS0IGG4_9BACT|nr:hypothetical protein [Hymenobacter jeongseonensis]MBF9237446.1 hypothetical protein [Hymenobacter jeongseonensis]
MANFLTSGIGNTSASTFEMGGLNFLGLLPYKDFVGKHAVVQGTESNSVIAISGMSLTTDHKFVEIGFVEGQASYTDAYTPSNTKRFMELTLNATVDTSGKEAIDRVHNLLLQRKVVALVQRKNGKWYVLGQSDGLVPAPGNANSGAARGDDSGITLSFTGGNRGFAAEVTMTDIEIEAVIDRL